MSLLQQINFGFKRKLHIILQTESAECGLACLAMLASYYGCETDLSALRRNYNFSLKGSTLADLIRVATLMELGTRPLKLELEQLSRLSLPCIIHWNFNHFVVLQHVAKDSIRIFDPAVGVRRIALADVSTSFTGVALEVWPKGSFVKEKQREPVKLIGLMGRVTGLHRSFVQILILAVALEIFALVNPLFMQWVLDDVIVSGDLDLLTTLVFGFGLLMLVQQIITVVRAWIILYLGTTLNIQWRANVFTHMLQLPIQYFERRNLGDIVSRFNSIDQIQSILTTSFLEGVLDGLMSLVTLIMMFVYNVELGMIAVGAMVLYAVGRAVLYRPLRDSTAEQIIHGAKQQSHFIETVRGAKAIKLFANQFTRRTAWLSLLVDQTNAGIKNQKIRLLYGFLNGLLFGIENILIIWLGAKNVVSGTFSVGVLMAFYAYKSQFDNRVSSLIDKYYDVKMIQIQADRLSDIVNTAPEVVSRAPGDEKAGNESASASIKIADLHYQYAVNDKHVLSGVTLNIAGGESVAIVGPSGCGKTTLMNILLGILAPSSGSIEVGGINPELAGVEPLRQVVSSVLQDDVLFAGSIAENISFFDSRADAGWIEACAKNAAILAEIRALPMGFNTLVGEMGSVLSGGQKQRILLARALYKKPKILFLDEATSHLDIAKEREVNVAIRTMRITRVIIAHRPETILSADRVVTLYGGKIVEDRQISIPPFEHVHA